jgi:MoaA/NifB/PqqE/SkfB family radical SAM enzyme
MYSLEADIRKKIDIMRGYLKHGFMGDRVLLDSSVLCQLKCPSCNTGNRDTGILGRGYLRFENFRKFVDQHPLIKRIELSNWGEIFLNPDLEKILAYGFAKGIGLTANGGVNFNRASDAQIEAIVKYELKSMSVSIDGACQHSYQVYRIDGIIENVIENIKKTNFYKRRYNKQCPVLTWGFILFGHNEQDLPKAKKMAKDLKMRFKVILNGDPDYSPVKNRAQAIAESGYASWHDQLEKTGKIRNHSCYQLWRSPVINWDGKLLGCARNRFGHYGNVFTEGLGKCIKGKKYSYAKKMVMGQVPLRKDMPCAACHIFDIMIDKNIYVQPFRNLSLKKQLILRLFYR